MRKHALPTVIQPRSWTTRPTRPVKRRAWVAVASVLKAIALSLIAGAGSSAAASSAPSARQQREERYVGTAILKGINGPACVREKVPATNPGPRQRRCYRSSASFVSRRQPPTTHLRRSSVTNRACM